MANPFDIAQQQSGGNAFDLAQSNRNPFDIVEGKTNPFDAAEKHVDKPERESLWEGFVWPTIKDVGRVGGTVAGTMAAFPASGIAGGLRGVAEQSLTGAGETVEEILSAPAEMTGAMDSPGSARAMEIISWPFEKIAHAAKWYGDKTVELTGSYTAGASVATAMETAAYLGMPGLKAKLAKQVKARKVTAARETIKEIHRERLRILKDEPEHLGELARKEAELKKTKPAEVQEKTVFDEAAKPKDLLKKKEPTDGGGGTTLSMLGSQGIYESIIKHAPKAKEAGKKAVEKFMDTVDVENRFIRVKAPETGFHAKNLFSKASRWEEWTIERIKDVGKASKFNKEVIQKAPLVTESIKSLKNADPIMKRVGKIYLDFSKKLQSEYKKRNVSIDYKKRILSEIQDKMELTADPAKLAELSQLYNKAKDLNFVHIPSALWFESKIGTPEGARSVMKLLAARQRKTFNIKSLIDKGKLDPKDINIADIMASQGRRAGRDFALLDMVRAAKDEGLAFTRGRSNIPPEFVSLPETKVPILKDYKVHPLLADYLTREILGRGLDLGSIQKYMSMAKMAAFINPGILPMYDLVQHAQLAAVNGPLRSLPSLARGIRKYALRDPEYYKALDNGLSSQPYNNPFNSYMDAAKWAQKRRISQVGLKAMESVLPHKAVKHIYNASWYLAWEMDKMIRMGSYELLRKKGYNPRDAAQIAAKFHSDYASVPPKIRRVLNVPFFTPTFKITMGKLYLRMMADAAKSAGDIVRFKIPKGKQATYAKAAIGTLMINEAYDLWMTQIMGWKRDEWGRRYVKDVDTEEGTKQLTMTFSAPSNMWHKYYFRWKHAHSPEVEKPLYRFLEQNKWEIQPVFRVLWGMVENKDEQGNPIVSQFDDDSTIAVKRLRYSVRSIVGLVGLVDRAKVDDEGRKKFIEEYGKVVEAAIRPFTFIYTRSPQNRKIMYQMKMIEKNFKKDLYNTVFRGEDFPEERFKNYEKKLNQIIKNIEE